MRKIYTLLLVSAIFSRVNAVVPEGNTEDDCAATVETTTDQVAVGSESNDADLSIFPNPVKSSATITFTYENVDKIIILNIVGREIKTITPENGMYTVKVNLVDLQPGVYFLAAYSQGNKLVTKRFQKEE